MTPPSISVIISTYNQPKWLEKVLWGYSVQTYKDFEIIIADDGSEEQTAHLISSFKEYFPVPLQHLWHEDKGYRRQEILNIAITKARHDYIIMTDGDCIPHKNMVAIHAKHAKKGYFLSGGYCKVSMKLSNAITREAILAGDCFRLRWLRKIDTIGFSQALKLGAKGLLAHLLNHLTPTRRTFNNCNSSAWKADIVAINGYDERMKYGGSDVELGDRLKNNSIKAIQVRHTALCIHLDHPRSYKTPESLANSSTRIKYTRENKIIFTPYGIKKRELIYP